MVMHSNYVMAQVFAPVLLPATRVGDKIRVTVQVRRNIVLVEKYPNGSDNDSDANTLRVGKVRVSVSFCSIICVSHSYSDFSDVCMTGANAKVH